MPAGGKPTVRSRRFGRKMQRHRLNAGFDQAEAAAFIHGSRSKISRMEDGITTAKPAEVLLLLDRYGVKDESEREHLVYLAKNSNHRGWWLNYPELSEGYRAHISLEDEAEYIQGYQPQIFPGLLQTPEFAAMSSLAGLDSFSPETVAQMVKVREERQAKIAKGGARYAVVIWELVVTQPLVPNDVHCGQLERLLDVGVRRNVTIQILPLSAGVKSAMTSAFSCYSFDDKPAVEAVVLENLRGASVMEGQDDLTAYTNAFDQLRSAALSPDASAELIRGALRRSKEDAT
jgi:Domain of unknown function (DUF5753)/Helix-turn-helix domain